MLGSLLVEGPQDHNLIISLLFSYHFYLSHFQLPNTLLLPELL